MARSKRKEQPELTEVALTIKFETFLRLTVMVVGTIILLTALKKASHALLLISAAAFLALALNNPVHWIGKQIPGKVRGNRVLATTISYLIVVILIGAFIASVVPPLIRQTDSLVTNSPHLVQEFRSQNSPVGKIIRQYHLQKQVNVVSTQLSDRLKNAGGTVFVTVKKVGSSFFSLLTILVLTFMMLVEGPRWIEYSKQLLPDKHHPMAQRMAEDMYKVIKGYVNGQVVLAAIAAVLIMPAVLLLHISSPAALVIVIFVCGLIPMVGHTIGAIIVTLVALFHSTSSAVIILAYYILYQQIENYFIQPRIQANTTNMSPLLVFMSLIIGVSFGGLFGGIVAIPVAGCIRIVILEYMRTKGIIDNANFEKITTKETKQLR